MRTLFGIGAIGETIKGIQQTLTQAGFDTKGADGFYGQNTATAVMAFQSARSLAVTGTLEDGSWQLLMQRPVAEDSAGFPLRLLRAHTFAYQLLRALLNMQAHFLVEIAQELAATEDVRYPVHWSFLLVGRGFSRIEDERNAFEHSFEAGDLLFQVAET